jgi:hypothetical protein
MSKRHLPKPAKALPHVVTALIDKRGKLAGQIDKLQSDLRQAVLDLDNVEATLRMFAPEMELAGLAPRNVPPALPAMKGDTGRMILQILRHAPRPLTTSEITEALMKERALDINNPTLFRTMSKRTIAVLRHWKNERGAVRSMPGPGQQLMWQVVPMRAE